jgi:hypothetical protein
MRLATARLSLVAAGLAVAGLVGTAGAASAPTALGITDPTGDVQFAGHGDITKLTYTTSGVTTVKKVRTKTVKTYTAKNLVVSEDYADAIDTTGTTVYQLGFSIPACSGGVLLVTQPGSLLTDYANCSDGTLTGGTDLGVSAVVAGKNITWTIPLSAFGGAKIGDPIDGTDLVTGWAEPAQGTGPYLFATFGAPSANDELTSDSTYKIG